MLHKSQFNHSSTGGSYYCSIRRAVQTLLGLCINKRCIRVPVLGLTELSDSNFIYCKPIRAIHEQNVHPPHLEQNQKPYMQWSLNKTEDSPGRWPGGQRLRQN